MNPKQDTAGGPREFRRRSDIEKPLPAPGDAELRIAIEATGLGIFDYYPLSGELHWSSIAKEHFGLPPDAHVNYNVFLVALHQQDRERVEQLMRQALRRENSGALTAEFRATGIEDEQERWIAVRGQAFFNHGGEAVRFIGTTQDITGRKRDEERLKRALQELEQANRKLQRQSPADRADADSPERGT